jgi:hypothetical protein
MVKSSLLLNLNWKCFGKSVLCPQPDALAPTAMSAMTLCHENDELCHGLLNSTHKALVTNEDFSPKVLHIFC